jgi:hypothetical protein
MDRPADFGMEVGDPREHSIPVGAHLGSPDEGPARMRRLLAAVALVEETGRGIEIMRVHGHDQPVDQIPRSSSAIAAARVTMVPTLAQGVQRLTAAAVAYA